MDTTPPSQLPFVGREAERAALRARRTAAASGHGSVVRIVGEPGAGKTRLLAEFARESAEAGWTVLSGRALDALGAPPYLIVAEALRTHVRTTPVDILRAQLGEAAADVALIVPGLATRLTGLVRTPALSPEWERYRLFESMADFLQEIAAASAGLLLILDDLHWADEPSLHLLLHLARRLAGSTVLIGVAYRDSEVERGGPLATMLADLVREGVPELLHLRGLSLSEVRDFTAAATGLPPSESLLGTIMAETEGNPLFVVELLRLLITEGRLTEAGDPAFGRLTIPHSVHQVIGRRLDHLSPACHTVLTLAAVIGRVFSVPLLVRAGGSTADEVLDALDEAEAARVVVPQPDAPGRYAFAHPLIRESLYDQVLSARRVRLHRRVAEALEALHAAGGDDYLAELAHHAILAAPGGDAAGAAGWALRAGDLALNRFAYEDAVRWYRAALQCLDLGLVQDRAIRSELLVSLAVARLRAGETGAPEAVDKAADAARSLGSAPLLGRLALAHAGFRGSPGVTDPRVAGLLEEALALTTTDHPALRARLLARLATELSGEEAARRRDALSAEAVQLARALDDPATLATILVSRHYSMHAPEQRAEREAVAAEVLRLAERARDPELTIQGYYLTVLDRMEAGDRAGLDTAIAAHERMAADLRRPFFDWRHSVILGMRALISGDLDQASKLISEAFAIGQRHNLPSALAAFAAQFYMLRSDQGTLAEISGAVEAFATRLTNAPTWRCMLALAYLETGRREQGRAEFDLLAALPSPDPACQEPFSGIPGDDLQLTGLALLAEVCADLDDTARAPVLYRRLQPYAGRIVAIPGGVGCVGAVDRLLGMLATVMRDWSLAETHLLAARALCARFGTPAWEARALLSHAMMLHLRGQDGDLDQARAHAESALEITRALGMQRLVEQATAMLAELVPTQPPALSLPNGLSLREAEVLQLLAAGQTNREIAEALTLSARTVDNHIASIYRKIGAHRRADATAFALRHGLLTAQPVEAR